MNGFSLEKYIIDTLEAGTSDTVIVVGNHQDVVQMKTARCQEDRRAPEGDGSDLGS